MSAYYVGFHHIDCILNYVQFVVRPGRLYIYSPRQEHMIQFDVTSVEDMSTIGKALLVENCKSLAARYPEDWESMLPDDHSEDPEVYAYKPLNLSEIRSLTPQRVYSALDCYDYQTCEHTTYRGSLAFQITVVLREHLVDMEEFRPKGPSGTTGWSFEAHEVRPAIRPAAQRPSSEPSPAPRARARFFRPL